MDALGVVFGLMLLFGVAVLSMLVVAGVKAAKAVAAKVDRAEANARRQVENVTLKAKSFTKPGAQGRLSAVRLGLRTTLDSTRKVLEAGLPQDSQLAEPLQLLARLDDHAAELDRELRLLEREPDPVRIETKLPELSERADRITHAAESMRWAAQDRLHRFAADELSRLAEECEQEAGALRHWDTAAAGASASAQAAASGTGSASAGSAPAGATPVDSTRKGIGFGGQQLSTEEFLGLTKQRLRKQTG
ncbi:hypothetical protein CFP65_2347 [Kitasatospora sp. MMS16-BH015]|uniref:hypothetical protein n=1 Tax=Kitasatospora sp. MMS16-BH015 TaxID=2018025 RepID=UPI000CA1C897|nr:hypothetical protein [Kitasatospora sp. MMS16-BH015]AUG77185.1 hypothetical protein CFP65_2347 [Kitasatospora sp. MMS16-BH015]